jgi:protocatechuate 3,4-dioxygenase beta subunit
MPTTSRTVRLLSLATLAGSIAVVGAQPPARDQAQATAAGTAVISGSVIAADTGRPLKRVRIVVSGSSDPTAASATAAAGQQAQAMGRGRMEQLAQMGGGPNQLRGGFRVVRSVQTDELGRYEIRALPSGSYIVTATKAGFVDAVFGQRRPLRPGTPIEVADGQEIKNVSFSLPRGSVITGQILDEDGEPVARAAVTVMRYQYLGGQRQLVPAGGDQTDDRGVYRVFGLPPGDYYVSAVARLFGGPGRGPIMRAMVMDAEEEETLGYAPTFYPGVTTPAEASRLTVGLAQEMAGVDFQLRLVPMAKISGIVLDADGTPLSGGNVMLVSDADTIGRGATFVGRVGSGGTFAIDNVPPGRYVLWARGRGSRDEPVNFAVHSLSVNGQDLANLVVALSPGATISGSVRFEGTQASVPSDLSAFRISVPALDPIPFGGSQTTRVEADGRFEVTGIPAGRRAIRASNPPSPWSLKSVIVDGRDVTDEALDVRIGQRISAVQVVFTDQVATVAGSLIDARGELVYGYTVILFSSDSTTWRPQARTIQAVQPDQTGSYRFRGMPPGDYYIAAVDDVEQGEWYDPAFLQELQAGAARLRVTEGATVAHDLEIAR